MKEMDLVKLTKFKLWAVLLYQHTPKQVYADAVAHYDRLIKAINTPRE